MFEQAKINQNKRNDLKCERVGNCELWLFLPVLTPQAGNGFRFVLHISAIIVKQWLIVWRLLCIQFKFIASGTVLGLWLCHCWLRGWRLYCFLLWKGLLLLWIARACYARFFFFQPRRWICWRSTDDFFFLGFLCAWLCVNFYTMRTSSWVWGEMMLKRKIIKKNIKIIKINIKI